MRFATVFLVIVMTMSLLAAPALTREVDKPFGVSLGILSSTEGSDLGMGTSLSLAYDLPTQFKACRLQAAVSYVRFSGSFEDESITETIIPVTIRGIKDFEVSNASYKPYGGVGIGIMQLNVSGDGESLSNTTYCYELIAGARFGEATFAELKVLGSPDSDTGIGLNIGYRF